MERTTEQLERIRDFVAALRSGEYDQTKNRLRTGVSPVTGKAGYCCEGVAFERYGVQLGYGMVNNGSGAMIALGRNYPSDDNSFAVDKFMSTAVAPPEFWQDMGMRDRTVYNGFAFELPNNYTTRDENREWEEYASLNDAGFTFPQIADIIEWQYLSCPAAVD